MLHHLHMSYGRPSLVYFHGLLCLILITWSGTPSYPGANGGSETQAVKSHLLLDNMHLLEIEPWSRRVVQSQVFRQVVQAQESHLVQIHNVGQAETLLV